MSTDYTTIRMVRAEAKLEELQAERDQLRADLATLRECWHVEMCRAESAEKQLEANALNLKEWTEAHKRADRAEAERAELRAMLSKTAADALAIDGQADELSRKALAEIDISPPKTDKES